MIHGTRSDNKVSFFLSNSLDEIENLRGSKETIRIEKYKEVINKFIKHHNWNTYVNWVENDSYEFDDSDEDARAKIVCNYFPEFKYIGWGQYRVAFNVDGYCVKLATIGDAISENQDEYYFYKQVPASIREWLNEPLSLSEYWHIIISKVADLNYSVSPVLTQKLVYSLEYMLEQCGMDISLSGYDVASDHNWGLFGNQYKLIDFIQLKQCIDEEATSNFYLNILED